jgi:type I restriction enzyme S subunit
VDTLVTKKRELIEKLKEKRTALISRTVTCGLPPEAAHAAGLSSSVIPGKPEGRDPESRGEGKDWIPASAGMTDKVRFKSSGIEWLGDIPEHWEVVQLFRIAATIQTGPFGSQLHHRTISTVGFR